MSKTVLIDFKDSFTYTISHYLTGMNVELDILEDGHFDIQILEAYDTIILSPGPGLPREKKSLIKILEKYANTKKILGICLGMQGIVEFFEGSIYNLQQVSHGVQVEMFVSDHSSIFKGLPATFQVGLYHSWACDTGESKGLKTIAKSINGVTMAVKHLELPIFGVQFHPESILTENGKQILLNFVNFEN
jgi:anthranilate synthase component II